MKYKIDDVAKECGVTKRSIRYYEEIGLVSPPERSEGGYRLYTQEHIDRIKKIVDARDVLGFSLQEIQQILSIREEIEKRRQDYRQIEDEKEKRIKLQEFEQVLAKQLKMVDQKLEKMIEIRKDMDSYYQRVLNALENMK